jgi:hypothetical protein
LQGPSQPGRNHTLISRSCIHVLREEWLSSCGESPDDLKNFPGEDKKGSVVVKFNPEGKILMTLGKPGVRGNPPEALTDSMA